MTTYVRENSPARNDIATVNTLKNPKETLLDTKVKADIQAILTVIKRRKYYYKPFEPGSLDLQKANLREAHLEGAHLEEANLEKTELIKAHLIGTHFEGAKP
ncbi:pentapeptide repeat-containing protein [Methanosarcina sp.]|uniref:pentapeptide repeat-containing protein n=1 Tax=Methanosarcina sp. TaxID=2213 RepID=UPI002AB83062|nr:pentapeptide repeat-containing protein [Methanosarcina sp.]MDY9925311.1 pentapeptide repeat-containing protein [Methanosarcina sp.]